MKDAEYLPDWLQEAFEDHHDDCDDHEDCLQSFYDEAKDRVQIAYDEFLAICKNGDDDTGIVLFNLGGVFGPLHHIGVALRKREAAEKAGAV